MNFSDRNGFFRVTRVTGPTHNLLGVSFSGTADHLPQLRNLERSAIAPAKLDPMEVLDFVLKGISDANSTFGLSLHPSEIEFVGSDSPPETTYRLLAFELIKHFYAAGKIN